MSQDTRKDKRAKVVSLNVRYKSATVDEFIENHSHDVSKGGLFVKTPTPFPPGTLLKFEIRLAGDKSVISGVGRVVWKREPTQAGADKPAGMGVKFIKIDDSSRAIIDRLITQKADAGSAYMAEQPEEDSPAGHPSTLRGLVAAPIADAPAAAAPPPKAAPVNVPAPSPGASAKLPVPPPTSSGAGGPPPPVAKSPFAGGTLAGPRPTGLPGIPAPAAAPPPAAAAPAPMPPPAPSSKPGLGGKAPPRPAGGPPPPQAKPLAQTAIGVAPAPGGPPPAAAGAAPADKPSSEPKLPPTPGAPPPRPAPPARKATMMGIGIPSTPPAAGEKSDTGSLLPSPTPPPAAPGVASAAAAAAASATPPPPKAAEPMFPKMDPESGSEPAREQTVMKQAAELLEEALKEAGGSLDEIGQNPLFQGQGDKPLDGLPESARVQSGDTLVMQSPMSGDQPSPIGATPGLTGDPPGVRAAGPASTSPSAPLALPASAKAVDPPRRLGDDLDGKKKGGSGGLIVALLLLLLVGGGGIYAWKSGMLAGIVGGPAGTSPTASTPVPPPPPSMTASASSATPVAMMDGSADSTDASAMGAGLDAGAAKDAEASTDAGKDAGKEKDAGKAAAPTTAVAPPRPPPRPRPPTPPVGTPDQGEGETPAPAPTPKDPTPAPTAKDPAPAPTPTAAPTKDPANEL